MKTLFALVLLVFVGFAGHKIGQTLSTDAVGMALGMLFGIMAGIPTALILLASTRERCDCDCHRRPHQRHHEAQRPQIVEQNYYLHVDAEIPTQQRLDVRR